MRDESFKVNINNNMINHIPCNYTYIETYFFIDSENDNKNFRRNYNFLSIPSQLFFYMNDPILLCVSDPDMQTTKKNTDF